VSLTWSAQAFVELHERSLLMLERASRAIEGVVRRALAC
jgi:hypothetical protein